MQMKDAFYKYVALGLGSVYALQVLLTVGGSTKFIPMTGVTLPLVSYGGSSLLSTMIIFGMIQGMYIMQAAPEKRRNIDDKRRKDHETKNRQKQTAKAPHHNYPLLRLCADSSSDIPFAAILLSE